MSLEIERTFKVNTIPEDLAKRLKWNPSEQFYIATGKEELRARWVGGGQDVYTLTLKVGDGPHREEMEIRILPETYQTLLRATDTVLTRNIAYIEAPLMDMAQINCSSFRLSQFTCEPFNGLILAEVEFSNVRQYDQFEALPWFGEEVTHDSFYCSQNMWRTVRALQRGEINIPKDSSDRNEKKNIVRLSGVKLYYADVEIDIGPGESFSEELAVKQATAMAEAGLVKWEPVYEDDVIDVSHGEVIRRSDWC